MSDTLIVRRSRRVRTGLVAHAQQQHVDGGAEHVLPRAGAEDGRLGDAPVACKRRLNRRLRVVMQLACIRFQDAAMPSASSLYASVCNVKAAEWDQSYAHPAGQQQHGSLLLRQA